ncbi:MAG: pimeloyl-ACP methyl ester carboxylesterase [Cognaticolwellia sp.]|jgi:pimeloyl-ACP methyl ester carboxylesterase
MNTLILVHGASGNAHTWSPVLKHFSPWCAPLAIDLPGRGQQSDPPLSQVSALAEHVAKQLQAQATKPVVLGHSLGGAVCLQLALDYPDLIAGLVMVSSSSRLRVHPAILKMVAESSAEQPYRLDPAFGPGTPKAIRDSYAELSAGTPPKTALADWQACNTFDVRTRLGELRCPALVVHGDQDLLTLAKYQGPLAQALRAQHSIVAGAGHMLPWEAPGQLADAVQAWAAQDPEP